MKKIPKQIEVGLDPQKGFTQVNKNRDVEDGIRGQVMHLNPPPNGEEGPRRNRKRENRGPEEHKEGKHQIRFPPHEEKTPPRIYANGSRSEVEEDDSLPDSTDESRYTYSTSTHGPLSHLQRRRPPSPSKQISLAP